MSSTTYKILTIKGDGIGHEIVPCGKAVLEKISQKFNHNFVFDEAIMGHTAILSTGNPLPDQTLEKAKNSDAILFGAIGDPSYDNNPKAAVRPEQGLLRIRTELGLFANLRPIQIFDELSQASPLKPEIVANTDILFFRELTGGIYFGKPRERRDGGNTAVDTCIYTKEEVRRIAIMAFESARLRQKKITSVDKANVLETSRLWRETVNEVAKNYPDIQLEHQLVDSMAMKLMSSPSQYDVVLTENLFGDILTDQASQIAGSLGMLASASIGNSNIQNKNCINFGLFEPIHGSAPDIAGQNIANPLACILSAGLLLEIGLGLKTEADAITNAVKKTLAQGYRTIDIKDKNTPKNMILGTVEMSQKVLENI
jgi:3-isopropylmalate dehydrogenase